MPGIPAADTSAVCMHSALEVPEEPLAVEAGAAAASMLGQKQGWGCSGE